jgi:1-acyl-sn-glycerol-3-phosphate acyltransferase
MPDAEIIPIGVRGAPGRGSTRPGTPSSASRALAPTPAKGTTGSRTRKAPASGARAAAAAAADTAPDPTQEPQPQPDTQAAAQPTTDAAAEAATVRAAHTGSRRNADALPPEPLAELLGLLGDLAGAVLGEGSDETIARAMAVLRRRLTGDYELDEFGLDPHFADHILFPLFRPLFQQWFRVEVRGLEHIPSTGGALVVANHAGTIALDATMTSLAIHDQHPAHRMLRMLGADFVFGMPFIGEMARRSGATLACNEDAHRLLAAGELVGVWPEGVKGIGKRYSERYKLQRFGRGGFVASAIRAEVPIIPTAIVGSEETYPIIGDVPVLARLLGMPFFPMTPTFPWLGPLGLVPLPSKWIIEFGEPLRTDELGAALADDPMAVFEIGDQVRESIQQSLYLLLRQRRTVFF